ncbi:MAG: DUF6132 family protein [Bacteroidota bacterium]|nr:DUF6132 family protein [Bacteroidota bacterium]
MRKWLLSNIGVIFGTIIGALTGYIYYKQIGCSSGSCVITSNPYNSIMYFSVMGALLMNYLKPKTKKETE